MLNLYALDQTFLHVPHPIWSLDVFEILEELGEFDRPLIRILEFPEIRVHYLEHCEIVLSRHPIRFDWHHEVLHHQFKHLHRRVVRFAITVLDVLHNLFRVDAVLPQCCNKKVEEKQCKQVVDRVFDHVVHFLSG